MVQFRDALTLDAPRRTKDGFVAVRARAARTGVYDYSGREVDPDNKHGLRDQSTVKVMRDERTVFDNTSARSFIGKPVTDDHPSVLITADNWRDYARGTVMAAMRDGDYLAFDLLLTDAAAIRKVYAGKRELSNGYTTDLEFGDFTAADGTKCQARQTSITGNHVALVDSGRAGSECAIKDGFAVCDAIPAGFLDSITLPDGDIPMKTMTIDGLKVPNVSDEAEAAIIKLQADSADANTKLKDAQAKVAESATALAAKDAEIATLKKQVDDAAITPAKLRDAAKAYALVCDKAKALGVTVAEDASTETVMKAVVDAKLGDTAKDWTADQIAISFATLTKGAATADAVHSLGSPTVVADAEKLFLDAQAKASEARRNAWRGPAAA